MTNIDEALDAAIANNTDEAVLGLDIGGTSIKMGVVTRVGKVLATAKVPTGELDNAEAFDRVSTSAVALVREAGKDPETLGAIGIDVPGVVLEDGTLAMTPRRPDRSPQGRLPHRPHSRAQRRERRGTWGGLARGRRRHQKRRHAYAWHGRGRRRHR